MTQTNKMCNIKTKHEQIMNNYFRLLAMTKYSETINIQNICYNDRIYNNNIQALTLSQKITIHEQIKQRGVFKVKAILLHINKRMKYNKRQNQTKLQLGFNDSIFIEEDKGLFTFYRQQAEYEQQLQQQKRINSLNADDQQSIRFQNISYHPKYHNIQNTPNNDSHQKRRGFHNYSHIKNDIKHNRRIRKVQNAEPLKLSQAKFVQQTKSHKASKNILKLDDKVVLNKFLINKYEKVECNQSLPTLKNQCKYPHRSGKKQEDINTPIMSLKLRRKLSKFSECLDINGLSKQKQTENQSEEIFRQRKKFRGIQKIISPSYVNKTQGKAVVNSNSTSLQSITSRRKVDNSKQQGDLSSRKKLIMLTERAIASIKKKQIKTVPNQNMESANKIFWKHKRYMKSQIEDKKGRAVSSLPKLLKNQDSQPVYVQTKQQTALKREQVHIKKVGHQQSKKDACYFDVQIAPSVNSYKAQMKKEDSKHNNKLAHFNNYKPDSYRFVMISNSQHRSQQQHKEVGLLKILEKYQKKCT